VARRRHVGALRSLHTLRCVFLVRQPSPTTFAARPRGVNTQRPVITLTLSHSFNRSLSLAHLIAHSVCVYPCVSFTLVISGAFAYGFFGRRIDTNSAASVVVRHRQLRVRNTDTHSRQHNDADRAG